VSNPPPTTRHADELRPYAARPTAARPAPSARIFDGYATPSSRFISFANQPRLTATGASRLQCAKCFGKSSPIRPLSFVQRNSSVCAVGASRLSVVGPPRFPTINHRSFRAWAALVPRPVEEHTCSPGEFGRIVLADLNEVIRVATGRGDGRKHQRRFSHSRGHGGGLRPKHSTRRPHRGCGGLSGPAAAKPP